MKKCALLSIAMILAATRVPAGEAVDFRLPPEIQPLEQRIELRIDPSVTGYSGRVSIDLQVRETVPRIGIYQIGLEMSTIELSADGPPRQLRATPGEYDINWLADGEAIAPGEYRLSIDFSGEFATDALGMHRVSFEGHDYVFTQFEAMYGRRAIPLFDEPSFKIPYQLTIVAPEGQVVISNTPVAVRSSADGWQRVEFEVTKPLPSYLIAYAVGPLDRAPLEGMSVPGFVYTPRGHADDVGFVLRETPKIVAALEEYFDMPYPYRKLDFVAVPDFAFGAMENPGLITYRTELLIVGDELQGSAAETVLSVIAHEVGHIWFGDLVTMGWWNDLWLNEAFASWVSAKMLRGLYPELESDLGLVQTGAFNRDRHTSSRQIRRTVKTQKDGFSDIGLNYTKGAVLLRMLENYIGADAWQEGMRAYMRMFAWRNAADADLWAAMSDASGLDVSEIAASFLDQPGYAILDIGQDGTISQQRYLMDGKVDGESMWRIPLTIKYKKDDAVRRSFYLLQSRNGQLDLPDDNEWVFPDADATGYFRWKTDPNQFRALVADAHLLTDREKIALLDNSRALFERNDISLAAYMEVVQKMLGESHPLVVRPALSNLLWIGENFVAESSRAPFGKFVDHAAGPLAARFGLRNGRGDSEVLIKMRPTLLMMLGRYGLDPGAREAAADIAEQYMVTPDSIDGGLGTAALRVTALAGNGARYGRYIEAYNKTDSVDLKRNLLRSVYFLQPEIVSRHLDFTVSDAVTGRDSVVGIATYTSLVGDHEMLYRWLDENLELLEPRLPEFMRPILPRFMLGACSRKNLELMLEFFGRRGDKYATALENAVERTESCIARKQRISAPLAAFLSNALPQ